AAPAARVGVALAMPLTDRAALPFYEPIQLCGIVNAKAKEAEVGCAVFSRSMPGFCGTED
ncbi:hypothetical protein, partial [Paenibacillus sp. 1-18]|uniref:hypothetical protein n=1 Tax=Paenibacillus sp. 1-18 TaxID=1333846 RepID=UPI00046F1A8F